MVSLRKFFGDGAYKGSSTTWINVFPFDRSHPVLQPAVPTIDEPICTQRISRIIKIQLAHKSKR